MLAIATHDTAAQFAWLWHIYLWLTVGVGVIVAAFVLFAAIRFRRRSDAWPRQKHSAPRLEAVYVVAIAVIVIGLLVATFHVENQVDALASSPALRIRVTGFQWAWQFTYPNGYTNTGTNIASGRPRYATLVVPAAQPVEFDVRSGDVLHSFFIPAMRFKRYAFPNFTNRFVLTFPHPGRMLGECAQFCGWDHAEMRFTVRILPAAAFRSWLSARPARIAPG